MSHQTNNQCNQKTFSLLVWEAWLSCLFLEKTAKWQNLKIPTLHLPTLPQSYRRYVRGSTAHCMFSCARTYVGSGTYSVHIGQLVPVLEPRFRLPEHVIDLLLHPGLQLRVVHQNSDQRPKHHQCGDNTCSKNKGARFPA